MAFALPGIQRTNLYKAPYVAFLTGVNQGCYWSHMSRPESGSATFPDFLIEDSDQVDDAICTLQGRFQVPGRSQVSHLERDSRKRSLQCNMPGRSRQDAAFMAQ
jgi:hypothetical protein